GDHLERALGLERRGGFAQGIGGVHDVVHDDAGTVGDVADDVHDLGDIGLGPPLVDDGEVGVELLGQCTCTHHAADIGRHHDQVFVVALPQVAEQDGRGVDVVDRNVEETLDLV